MKIFTQVLLIIFFKIGLLQAQPYFKFSMDTATYNELSARFGVFENEFWNTQSGSSKMLPMPFNFNFLGTIYSTVWIGKAGVATFFHPQTFLANRIYFYNTYYTEKNKQSPFVSSIAVNTIASGADSVFIVQYKNVGFYRSLDTSDYANFQLWLYKNSNMFEIRYGAIKADTSAWLNSIGAYVGIGKDEQATLVLLGGPAENPRWLLHRDTMLLSIPKPNTVYRFRPFITSVDDIGPKSYPIILYPNPAKKKFCLQTDNNLDVFEVKIFNLQGALVSNVKPDTDTLQIDIQDIAPGMYLVEIATNMGTQLKKLMIEY
jgi:hypothetical protein